MTSLFRETYAIPTLAMVVASGLMVAACNGVDDDQRADERAAASTAGESDGEHARAVIDRLRARHLVREPARFARPGLLPLTKTPKVPGARPLIGPTAGARFVRAEAGLQAKWDADSSVDVWVPVRSSDAFGLRDRTSGIAVQARLAGVRGADVAVTDGLAVYDGAGPEGGTIIHRLIEGGTEDYVTFETRPAAGELTYDLSLSGVAGLRLVSNTLEFIDTASDPRLRISPPYVVGAGGEVVAAELSLSGCAADHNPSAPWDRPPVAPGSDRCRVSVRWDADAVTYPAIVDPSWSSTGNMVNARSNAIGVAMSNNRVLAAGGFSSTGTVLNTAELYNPTPRTWAATQNMSSPRAYFAAALRGNGQVLVSGGTNGSVDLSSAATYDPAAGTWMNRSPMNRTRQGHQLTSLNGGDVLVSGGVTGGGSALTAQRFTNSGSTWTSAGSMLSSQIQHSATLLTDGRVVTVGGTPPAGQIFQPSGNTWTATANAPEQRNGHAAVRLSNGNVLVAGGYGPGGGMTAEVFNPTTNQWSRTGNLWQTHAYPAFSLLSTGRVLVMGDFEGNSKTISEIYDPTWGTWRPGPSVSPFRQNSIGARLQNNRILIAGGDTPTGVTNSSTEFIPTTTAVTVTEYKSGTGGLPAPAIDPDVLSGRVTELWASVHRPNPMPSGRLPLLIFLHGNHNTCGHGSNPRIDDDHLYTDTGTCNTGAGYTVVPNHRGYDYIANELASRNYLVVSINANRGINMAEGVTGDEALIAARGRLVLKHLQKLSEWDRNVSPTPSTIGVSLANKLDLNQVGLMGHSRGGDGVRSVPVQYKEPSPWPERIVTPVTFRGIFEIGPTDYYEPAPNNALDVRWSVLLPMCDGDMRNLDGVKVFDRMFGLTETTFRAKSTYTVWGANHNFYNTEWQSIDSFGCMDHTPMFVLPDLDDYVDGVTGSAEQRQSGFQPMLSFFIANVGNTNAPVDTWFNNVFNPESPRAFTPNVDRGYTPGAGSSQSLMLEDFLGASGTGSYGFANEHSGVSVIHDNIYEHPGLRAGDISWSEPGAYFQTNFASPGSPFNLTSYQTLDLRVDRAPDEVQNLDFSTDFYVQLVNSSGAPSDPVPLSSYLYRDLNFGSSSLVGPVGSEEAGRHTMLQTARIPLTAFTGANLASIIGVRLLFDATTQGRIFVANIRAGKSTIVTGFAPLVAGTSGAAPAQGRSGASGVTPGVGGRAVTRRITAGNTVVALRSAPDRTIKIELKTGTRFRGRNALLTLRIGAVTSTLSGFTSSDASSVAFTLDRKQFDAIADGAPIRVGYGDGPSDIEWDFGAFDKSQLVP